MINIKVGVYIGEWTILDRADSKIHSTNGYEVRFWLCRCSCGKIRSVNESKLKMGKSLGCGHKVSPFCKIPLVTLNKKLTNAEWELVHEMENTKSNHKRKLIQGVAQNDVNFITSRRVSGKLFHHPCYYQWLSMLNRVYGGYQKCYNSSFVCDEWHKFSNFYCWWKDNYVEGFDLDKDLLSDGFSSYSPETCCYLPNWVNSVITQKYTKNFGVTLTATGFRCYCTIDGISKHYYFKTEEDAKTAWNQTIFLKIKLTEGWTKIKSEAITKILMLLELKTLP